MSSTAISTFLAYNNTPLVTTHCGEIFCSQNLEYFLINCRKCSLEFNLLSCNLFIKHVKECVVSGVSDPGDQNATNQENSSYSIDNLLKDALKNNNIDDGPNVDDQVDPLMALKLEEETEKTKDEPQQLSDDDFHEDIEYLSDYQDEDDLTIDKVIRRKMIEGIIDEYKKHPILWDVKEKTADRALKKHHYKQIRKIINSKFKMKYTDKELRTQIQNLRCGYRRVLKRRERFEKLFTDGKMKFNPQLWYFDKLSFIEGTINDIEVDAILDCDTDPKVEASNDESSDSEEEQPNPGPKKENKERPSYKILSEPKIISDLIAQYKKYPFLWDQTAPLYNDKYARKDAFRKITKFINNKFMKNVTDKELRQQIVNLRSGYRRVQRKKHNDNYRISLWYYDELSFIDHKSTEPEEICNQTAEESVDDKTLVTVNTDICKTEVTSMDQDIEESQNYENLDHSDDDDEDDNDEGEGKGDDDNENCDNGAKRVSSRRRRTAKKVTLAIIEEYKQHPCLWNNYLYKTTSRFNRFDAIKEITKIINSKYNTQFTDAVMRNKLVQLRSSYRRVLRKKEAFEKKHANAKRTFHPQLWYFDKMTFIGTSESDFAVCRQKSGKTKSEEDPSNKEEPNEPESDEESDVDTDDETPEPAEENSEPGTETIGKGITKNKELLTGIIEEYKKMPCLWAVQHYSNDNLARRQAYAKLAKNVNARFKLNFTCKGLSREIIKMRSTYKRVMRRKREDPMFETKMWYADLLSFIERKPSDLAAVQDVLDGRNECIEEWSAETGSDNEAADGDDEQNQRKRKLKSREHVYEIIELYKGAPILWDTKHPQYTMRLERKKTIEKIIETLYQQYNYRLTVEDFRYQVRFLRESYFRAVRFEIATANDNPPTVYLSKPFFFSRMSFLEPFADKTPERVPALQMDSKPQSNEDFQFLVENKPLMIDFIELYKAHGCLWDQKDKDKNNPAAHSEAYDKIMNMFLQHDIIYTKDQVIAAIGFLHSSIVSTQKEFELYDTNNTAKAPIWFYEHLKFLGRIPRIKDKYCSHCDQSFRSLADYEKHKIEIAGDYPYKCSVCKAGFVSRSKYAYHQITHKEPHKCEQCGFQAYDRHNFNVHMRRHKGIYPFKCEHCEKGFVTTTELNRHLRIHTGERPFICEICGKSLPANSEYRQHMKRHRNQRDHKCEICDSAFYTPKTLRDHMASHSTERQHVCEVCGAAFKRKKTLHQHKALHAEHKKHKCKICGKLFAQKAGVYSHMKSHGLMLGSS